MDVSDALGPTCRCCMHIVFPYGPNCPRGQKIRTDSYQLDLAFQSYVSVAEQDRGRTGFPTALIQVSAAVALQTGAGAGCRSRHVSGRGWAVTAEADRRPQVAGVGDAAEATRAASGRCGGSRGGRSWRMRSLRRQVLLRCARRVERRHSEQLTFIAFREERHSEQLAAAR